MNGDANMIVKCLVQFSSGLSGAYYVGVVPRYYMYPRILPNVPGRVVDRRSDNPIESFLVHPPYVGSVEPDRERGDGYVLISSLVDAPYDVFWVGYAINESV